jgi:lipid-binding SYLF domain-containing protein
MKIQFMKNITLALCLTLAGSVATLADDKGEKAKASEESAKAAEAFREVMGAPDKAIPHEVLDAAECVAVFPNSKKGAFIVACRRARAL